MNRQAAYASAILGTISFIGIYQTWNILCGIPAILCSVIISVAVALICSYAFPAAPKECWEPYFVPEISESTRQAVSIALKDR